MFLYFLQIDIDRHPIKAVLSLIVGHIKVTDHTFCLPDVSPMTFCGGVRKQYL